MANLINEKQKTVVCLEYMTRFLAVMILLLSLIGLFILFYILPYYLSILNNDLIIAKQLDQVISIENKENVGEDANRIIMRTNDQLRVINSLNKNNISPLNIIESILANKNKNIKINRFAFRLSDSDQVQIIINGKAQDRQSLVSFISDLKQVKNFISVDLPVSDLAKENDIPFSINIKIKQ